MGRRLESAPLREMTKGRFARPLMGTLSLPVAKNRSRFCETDSGRPPPRHHHVRNLQPSP